MTPLLFSLPGNEQLAAHLATRLGAELGSLETRRFPDGETYVRLNADVVARSVMLVCTLDRPDDKTLRLLFAVHAARDLGAARVGLVAPYLAYMRQDKRFNPGEAITSNAYARLLSASLDWIVTIDPHLHRRSSMSEIYSVPVAVCHAAPKLSSWLREHVADAVVIGPDAESEQWAGAVAAAAGVPFTTLEKTRHADRDVEIGVRLGSWFLELACNMTCAIFSISLVICCRRRPCRHDGAVV
jgi:ribose-phosphate pyrophosphokinase